MDPWVYLVPGTTTTVQLSHYGYLLPIEDVLLCLLAANDDVLRHHGNQVIGRTELQYNSNGAELVFYPSRSMTWNTWGFAILGLSVFVNTFEFVEFVFRVSYRGELVQVGQGVLSSPA